MHNMFQSNLNVIIYNIVLPKVHLRLVITFFTHIGWFYTFVTNRSVFEFVSPLGEGTDGFLKRCVAHAAVQSSLFYTVHSNIVDRQCCRLVC